VPYLKEDILKRKIQLVFNIFANSTLRNLEMKEDGRKKPYMFEPQTSSLISDFACNVPEV